MISTPTFPLLTRLFCPALIIGSLSMLPVTHAQLQQASIYDDETKDFFSYESKRLVDIKDYRTNTKNMQFSHYGGWKARRVKATGFFRVEKVKGRWWVIDPEGYLYIHKAVNSVQLFDKFSPDDVYKLLPKFGMNGTGNWSDTEIQDSKLKKKAPLAYCPKYSFVSSYKRKRSDRLPIAVFDDEFVSFCKKKAHEEFSKFKDDPQVLGYFIDNELSWTFKAGLESHLDVNDPEDKNYQKAVNFLKERGKGLKDFTNEDADDYSVLMLERYLSVVCPAVRAVDPNHMILGPRFNKSWNRTKEFMEVAGRHLDIIAINHYHRWGTRSNELENIAKWTNSPLLISEFYAMEKIPNFEEIGAGWRVKDETSRALFYENFLITQLNKPYVVGFHWFNFQDDFADNNSSKTIARRGLIDIKGDSYEIVQASMKHMNDRIYDYINHVDSRRKPDVIITAEADASYKRRKNLGGEPDMLVRHSDGKFTHIAHVRFNPSSAKRTIASAKIQLFAISPDEKLTSRYKAELVSNSRWKETSIDEDSAPETTKTLTRWHHGDDIEIDVTEEVVAAIKTRSKISIRISGELDNGMKLRYGAREHPDTHVHPKLVIYYK